MAYVVTASVPTGGWGHYAAGRKVGLQCVGNGMFLVAEQEKVFGEPREMHGKGHWHVKHLGNGEVELRSHHGKFIAAHHNGHVYLHDSHFGAHTKFWMRWTKHGVVFQNVGHSRFLGIDPGVHGKLRTHHEITAMEVFREVPAV
eukprot:TRINITY_DN3370_c0_g2_i3.p1 TRINITY_DN3370_c0_g2~~TRINITY_DN3370_c0_g2_i3.p1  ORF type:complete len:163 (+),score=50.53 TRINITY_DN3370_c0_g2_i3:59-490(+)